MPEFTSTKSAKKLLQGPRPTPLKVRDESHKIRKNPAEPPQQQHQVIRQPVIIYTVSPKVIHTNPNDFMNLVQRLTGPSTTSTTSPSSIATSSSAAFQEYSPPAGALSPASAKLASIEKNRSSKLPKVYEKYDHECTSMDGIEISSKIDKVTGNFPGILSPNIASLPHIPTNFFTLPSDHASQLGYFNDLSPVLPSNKNYLESSFAMHSPSTFASPNNHSLDLFNNLFDL